MIRKASQYRLSCIGTLAAGLILSGCETTTPRYEGNRPPDPTKAVLIGTIVEGYLTQPHGLQVSVVKVSEPTSSIQLQTLGVEDDTPSPNLIGNLFMYEVPAGQYEIKSWRYKFYFGTSIPRPTPVIFTVKPGEIAYIGDLYVNALTYCLSNINHDNSINILKVKYPVLERYNITNITPQSTFLPWPSSDAKDHGKGICNPF